MEADYTFKSATFCYRTDRHAEVANECRTDLPSANSQMPITFTVERLRDGKSYATR